ncbi:CHAT domain-containing protein [Nonomuraea sp. B12E4]|uniref:CHAT domain-containing protein n=1 Tax=Nonomuraea sp. B12E4 TaxID=3153564 RepID=UPI00325CC045
MNDPAERLAARIERFEQAADPELIWDPAALAEAEQAMRALAGDRSDAATWRLIGILHLARYRLDQRLTQDTAVAGAFFAAVAVVDPGRLPEKLRGSRVPPGETADTWAGLVEEVFGHVDPAAYPHVGLLVHALVRRAMAHPTVEVAERLGRLLLQESMRAADPGWAPGALSLLGGGLVRLHGLTGDREVIDDAVHVLLRAALADGAQGGELAGALALAVPDDVELVAAYLGAAGSAPGSQDRSQALRTLVDLTQARAAASCADGDLLAFIRVGQCALDFWHDQWAHPGVLGPYAAGLVEWYVVSGNEHSLEAATEMLQALHLTPDETARGLGADPVVRLVLLGERRWRRYGVTGALADLDIAVEAMREAAELAPPGHPERPGLLTGLANALLRRAVVTGGDAAGPIAAARTALAEHGEQDPGRAGALVLLGRALHLERTARGADEAVGVLREALAAGGRAAVQVEAYGLVAEVLVWRALRAGAARRAEDLDEAVAAARQGAELALKSARDQVPAERALARALLARFSARGGAGDLAEALKLASGGDPVVLSEIGAVLDSPDDTPGTPPGPAAPPLDEPPGPVAPPPGESLGAAAASSGESLGAVPGTPDESLGAAAVSLALQTPDDDVAFKLLRFAERAADVPAEFLLDAGARLAELGRYPVAGRVLERAAGAAAGSPSRQAYALSAQGTNHEQLGEFDAALEAFRRSAAIHRSLGETGSEARQLGSMGKVLLRTGDAAGAVEHHLRAAALSESAGLAAQEAAHQADAAGACLAAGDPARAVTCAARARELYLGLGETRAAALVLVPAAGAAADQGDLIAAGERIVACTLELEARGAWEDACRALDAHAVRLAALGHLAQAATCENRLVEIVRRRGQPREPADEWYRVAQRRRGHGATDSARVAFELAEREYEAIGHADGAASVRYNLGVLAYTEGAAERALEDFGAAGERFATLRAPAKEAVALSMRAACLTGLERHDEALADLERALELAAAAEDRDALFTARLGRAALDVALGEFQAGAERLRSALGPAAGDPLKEAVVRDRLAALAARTGELRAQVAALELAVAGFRASGRHRLAALASIKLGFALEERGEFRRARAALESGLESLTTTPPPDGGTGLEGLPGVAGGSAAGSVLGGGAGAGDFLRLEGAPFEVVVAMAGGLDVAFLARLASIQLTMGDLTRGRATLEQALAALRTGGRGEPAERLELWLRLAEAEAAGDLVTARAVAEQALAADPTQSTNGRTPTRPYSPDSGDRSYLLARLSTYCRALGDLTAAHDHAARGYELRDERVIEHLRNLGTAARELGRSGEAVEHLTRAAGLARRPGSSLPAQLIGVLTELGRSLTDEARWAEAARVYDEGLSLAGPAIWRAQRSALLVGRAALHLKLGELDAAATGYTRAISLMEEQKDRTGGLATAYADLALIHLLRGERPQAVPLVERALDLNTAHGRRRGAVLDLIMLARLLDSARATVHLEEALTLARESGFTAGEAMALSRLGALDVAGSHASHASRAHRRLSTAIDLLEQLGHEPDLAAAHHDRSLAAEALGDLPGALADAERAGDLGHAPARDRAITLAARSGQGMTAWRHAEWSKAHALTAALGDRHPPVPSGVPLDLREAEQRALDAVRTLESAAHRTRDPAEAAALTRRARTARTGLNALWQRMKPLAPAYVTLRHPAPLTHPQLDTLVTITPPPDHPRPATPTAGASPAQPHPDTPTATGTHPDRAEPKAPAAGTRSGRARPGTTVPARSGPTGLLGFHVGGDSVTVLAHRTGWAEPRAFPAFVGPGLLADFAAATTGRRPGLLDLETRRHRVDLRHRMADLLLAPALEALGEDLGLLYLIPHAGLHRLPLHALAPGGRPLLERFPVVHAPSAAALTHLTGRAPAEGGRSLVLGFTVNPDDRPVSEGAAQDAAGLLGTRPHTGSAATAALLPGSWDVVHLSCPAAFDPADPYGSGIRLADGLLTARQLMSMTVDARLVILAAHEPAPAAAQETGSPAAGIAALTQALLHAGARSVLLTLWPPAAELTRALLRDFHTRLRDGTGQAQALRASVLDLRELYGSAEPELWAPYVLVGLPN